MLYMHGILVTSLIWKSPEKKEIIKSKNGKPHPFPMNYYFFQRMCYLIFPSAILPYSESVSNYICICSMNSNLKKGV